MVEFLPLGSVAPAAVERLLDAAFGADRLARTAYRLREGTYAVAPLSFAAMAGEMLVGSIQCWPVQHRAVDGAATPLVMVGPVAVDPAHQRVGLGRALMQRSLDAADTHADGALMMIGDPEYYGRFFGFTAEATGAWTLPGPVERHRLLARAVRGFVVPGVPGTIGPRLTVDAS